MQRIELEQQLQSLEQLKVEYQKGIDKLDTNIKALTKELKILKRKYGITPKQSKMIDKYILDNPKCKSKDVCKFMAINNIGNFN